MAHLFNTQIEANGGVVNDGWERYPIGATLSVTSNTITPTQSCHLLADVTASIDTIAGGTQGDVLYLRKNGSNVVTFNRTSSVRLPSASITIATAGHLVKFVCYASDIWVLEAHQLNTT